MCRLYGVTRAGYYAWSSRGPSARAQEDQRLLTRIRRIVQRHHGHYGSPRVHGTLRTQGVHVGGKRVARLMRQHRLRATVADLYRSRAGVKAFFASVPYQELSALAAAPDRVWVGDVTYLRVGHAWRYLAVVLDKCTRRVLAWALRPRRDVGLTLAALRAAVRRRRPPPGVVFHSDRGIEYAAQAYREALRDHGLVQSMNRPSTMNDNAHMESFFHTLKVELHAELRRVVDDQALRRHLATYIDYYNAHRGHTRLGMLSPVAFEAIRC